MATSKSSYSSTSGDYSAGNGSIYSGSSGSTEDNKTHSESNSLNTWSSDYDPASKKTSSSSSGSSSNSGWSSKTTDSSGTAYSASKTTNSYQAYASTGSSSYTTHNYDKTSWNGSTNKQTKADGWSQTTVSSGGSHDWDNSNSNSGYYAWTQTNFSYSSGSGGGTSSTSGSSYPYSYTSPPDTGSTTTPPYSWTTTTPAGNTNGGMSGSGGSGGTGSGSGSSSGSTGAGGTGSGTAIAINLPGANTGQILDPSGLPASTLMSIEVIPPPPPPPTSGMRTEPPGGYDSVAWAGVKGFFYGLGKGAKNVVMAPVKMVTQMGLNAWDLAGMTVDTVATYAGHPINFQVQGDASKALNSGQISVGEYYKNTAIGLANGALAGVPDELYATYQYANGQIDDDQYSERMAEGAMNNLLGATALKNSKIGNCPMREVPAQAAKNMVEFGSKAKEMGQRLLTDESTSARPKPVEGCPQGPNCFVAGTPVVIQMESSDYVVTAVSDAPPSDAGAGAFVAIGVGVGMALAKAKLETKEDNNRRQPKRPRRGQRALSNLAPEGTLPPPDDPSDKVLATQLDSRSSEELQATSLRHRISSRLLTTGMLCCFALGAWWWLHLPRTSNLAQAHNLMSPLSNGLHQLKTRNIEDIRLGQRVVGHNPLRKQTELQTDFDPATYRTIQLEMEQSGTYYELTFLRSLGWLANARASIGANIHLAMEEMGLDGPARVISINPCPKLEVDDGTGRLVVTGTMKHLANNILELSVDSQDTPLGVTNTHPIWSEDRQDFVIAGQLQLGEHLRQADGTLSRITKILPKRGPPEIVYNLEVDAEHVYHVGANGLLVHNSCGDKLYRYMSEAEAQIARKTGSIPNTNAAGAPKNIYITDRLYTTAGRAKTHLQLPEKPVYRVEIDPKNVTGLSKVTRVEPTANPKWGAGGGTEATTPNSIPIDPSKITRLKGT